jgi:hypothetical protein
MRGSSRHACLRGPGRPPLCCCAHAYLRPRVMLGAWSFDLSVVVSNFAMHSRGGCDASSENRYPEGSVK